MGFGSSTKTTNNSTQTTAIDPQLKARQDAVWKQAQQANQPYQLYTGQRFEGFNDDQTASFDAARTAATAGQGTLQSAIGGANALAGFTGQQVTPAQAQSFTATGPQNISGQMLGQSALGAPLTAQNVSARSGATGYEQYMNPFTNDVVNTSLGDIERARQEAANATRSQAAAAGAFGGSRSGVAESLTNRDFGNTAASTAAQLRQAGFTQALGFNQADQNRELQAGMSNQNANLQAGVANQGNLLQAGLANQRTDLAAQQANQAAQQSGAQFNAGQLQAGSQFNANLDMQGQQSNQAAAAQAAGIQLGANSQLGGFAGQEQQMGAQGADLLSRIGGQQQALGQAQRDFDYQQFVEGRQDPYNRVGFMQGILGNQQYGTTQTGNSTSVQETKQGIGSALLSGALTVGGAMLSPGGILNKTPGGGQGAPFGAPQIYSGNEPWMTSPFGGR